MSGENTCEKARSSLKVFLITSGEGSQFSNGEKDNDLKVSGLYSVNTFLHLGLFTKSLHKWNACVIRSGKNWDKIEQQVLNRYCWFYHPKNSIWRVLSSSDDELVDVNSLFWRSIVCQSTRILVVQKLLEAVTASSVWFDESRVQYNIRFRLSWNVLNESIFQRTNSILKKTVELISKTWNRGWCKIFANVVSLWLIPSKVDLKSLRLKIQVKHFNASGRN